MFSDFVYLPIGLYLVSLKLLEFKLSFWWSVLLLFILFASFDVFIITHNNINVKIKSDKKYIKYKNTENSENTMEYLDIQNVD